MIRFFKSPQPAIMIIIPIIIFVFWIRSAGVIAMNLPHGLPLWDTIASLVASMPAWLSFVMLFLIVCAEAIYLNVVLNKHEVIYKNTFVPALIFALFVSITPQFMQFHPVHLVMLLLIRVFDRLFALYKNEAPVAALFDTGFLSGIIALLFLPGVIVLPLILTALTIQRPIKIKEWLIVIIGFMLPFFFLSILMFWKHALPAFWADYLSHLRNIHSTVAVSLSTPLLSALIFVGVLLLLSLIKLQANFRKNIVRTRVFQQIVFIFLLLSCGSLFILKQIELRDFLFMLIPVTVFCSYLFISAKRRIFLYEYSLWALIGLILWNQFS
jgi:hypothetical protein